VTPHQLGPGRQADCGQIVDELVETMVAEVCRPFRPGLQGVFECGRGDSSELARRAFVVHGLQFAKTPIFWAERPQYQPLPPLAGPPINATLESTITDTQHRRTAHGSISRALFIVLPLDGRARAWQLTWQPQRNSNPCLNLERVVS
jgi:hypothetical protein